MWMLGRRDLRKLWVVCVSENNKSLKSWICERGYSKRYRDQIRGTVSVE
jgi:hypothetical protein